MCVSECVRVLITQSCLTLCDPMDWSLPGSSVHGIFQARVLEWGAIAFSEHIYTPIYKIGKLQGPSVQQREPYPVSYNNL